MCFFWFHIDEFLVFIYWISPIFHKCLREDFFFTSSRHSRFAQQPPHLDASSLTVWPCFCGASVNLVTWELTWPVGVEANQWALQRACSRRVKWLGENRDGTWNILKYDIRYRGPSKQAFFNGKQDQGKMILGHAKMAGLNISIERKHHDYGCTGGATHFALWTEREHPHPTPLHVWRSVDQVCKWTLLHSPPA